MRLLITTAVLLLVSVAVPAQMVSPAGTLDVMLVLQHTHVDAHTGKNGVGRLQHNIDLRAVSATIGVEYSVTDRLGLGLSVPYIRSRYRGPAPHPGVAVDDGSMHGTLQDLQLDATYALIRGAVIVSPFAGLRYPIRDYETMGHAAPGRGLKELEMGVSAGHQLLVLPNAFVGGSVSYTVSEAVETMRVNRSKADLQIGYAAASRLFVRAFAAWQRSHGGLDVPVPATSEWFHHHDQLARANHMRGGAGLIVSLSESVNLHLGYATVIRSTNAHMGRSVSIATSWSFAPRRRVGTDATPTPVSSFYQSAGSETF